MKAIYKEPGRPARIVDIANSLSALQEAVGGYIEAVSLAEDACILCDEEGRMKGLAPNTTICGMDFVGPILVVGRQGERFAQLEHAQWLLGGGAVAAGCGRKVKPT